MADGCSLDHQVHQQTQLFSHHARYTALTSAVALRLPQCSPASLFLKVGSSTRLDVCHNSQTQAQSYGQSGAESV